ncbi:amidase, partial [Roseomonas sp. KE2513]|uniref:amidase family protein n=1 Tax=Roseomonas sp. KE2513 TaxID=2479202 RepID=UPI0018E05EBB
VGLKPSPGRVARRNGLPIILHDAEVIGPIARTVDDLALTLSTIQGPLDEDRASLAFRSDDGEEMRAMRSPLRSAFRRLAGGRPIAEACAAVARNLAALGHTVTEGTLPVDLSLFEQNWPNVGAAGLAWLLRGTEWRGRVGAIYEEMIEKGERLTALDYQDALLAFREIAAAFARMFREYDLLLTPSSGALQWKAEAFGPAHHRAFTGVVNLAGAPGISIPADPSPDGMPIGFQLVAPYGADWRLVAMARQYEGAHPWAHRWPSV